MDTPTDPLAAMPEWAVTEAEAALADPELVRRVCDDVGRLGVAGERELAATLYLVGVSRLLPKPLAAIVQGPSSSGKSFPIERVAALFPPEAVIHATQMTPQSLFHMPVGALRNRWVVAGERSRLEDDDRAEATRALRGMLSSGRLSKLMPAKGEGGRIEAQHIEQEGPIAFVESTTLATVFEEDANRCLLLQTDEQAEQTRRILTRLAESHTAPPADRDRVRQVRHAIQRLLPQVGVRVPFADRLAELFDCRRVEARRAFPQLLGLVQASALLHFRQRQTLDGALVAEPVDYQIVRRLAARPLSRSAEGGVSDAARRFFDRLRGWAAGEFTSKEAVDRGAAGKSSVYGWLSELYAAGVLEQTEVPRGRSPARWRLTGQTPDSGDALLPSVENVFPDGVAVWIPGNNPQAVVRI